MRSRVWPFVGLVAAIAAGLLLGTVAPARPERAIAAVPAREASGAVSQLGPTGPALQPGPATSIDDPAGIHLAILADSLDDSVLPSDSSAPAGSRWVLLNVTVTNTGLDNFTIRPTNFELQGSDAAIFQASGVSTPPQFAPATLAPGQTVRLSVYFTVPVNEGLQSALFVPEGTLAYVIGAINR